MGVITLSELLLVVMKAGGDVCSFKFVRFVRFEVDLYEASALRLATRWVLVCVCVFLTLGLLSKTRKIVHGLS